MDLYPFVVPLALALGLASLISFLGLLRRGRFDDVFSTPIALKPWQATVPIEHDAKATKDRA